MDAVVRGNGNGLCERACRELRDPAGLRLHRLRIEHDHDLEHLGIGWLVVRHGRRDLHRMQADCSVAKDPCFTGDCINGVCPKVVNCAVCVKQADCAQTIDPCFTGDCVGGMCAAMPNCAPCTGATDCTKAMNMCFTGDCINGACAADPMCATP